MATADTKKKPELVVAIDFGTTGSGYVLQTLADYKHDHLKMYVNLQWACESLDYKTPTCLLVSPDKDEILFGDEAVNRYNNLRQSDHPQNWYFFRNFKMQIYEKKDVTNNTMLVSENGNKLTAVFVLSESIKWMKDHVFRYMESSGFPYVRKLIKWVLTVPAIWTEGAKQLMRRSAEKAGIDPDQLCIALEPEAAAIYCTVDQANPQNDPNMGLDRSLVTGPGTTNMIVDIGGGTVDITTISVQKDGTMKQIHMAEGGPAGGQNVDKKFFSLMAELLTDDVWSYFQSNLPLEFYEFRMSFERAKRTIKPSVRHTRAGDHFLISLPRDIIGKFEITSGEDFNDVLLRNPRTDNKVKFSFGKLEFKCEILRKLMRESLKEIMNYITEVATDVIRNKIKIDAVIIVGGFASSTFLSEELRHAVKEKFDIPVKRPPMCEQAVMRGAAMYGHNEQILTSRIVRMTYGIGVTMPYGSEYPEEKKFALDGSLYVTGVFDAHVKRGQEVKIDEWMSASTYYPLEANQKEVDIYVFSTPNNDTTMIDDDGCECIGKFHIVFDFVRPKARIFGRSTEISFNFGRTELIVRAKDTATDKEVIVPLSLKD